MEIKDLIANISKKYSQKTELDIYGRRRNIGLLLAEDRLFSKHILKRGKLLDVGCGCGREAIALSKLGFEVVGVDIVFEMVKNAHLFTSKNGHKIEFCNMNLMNLGIKRKSFDAVFLASQVLGHIPKRENRVKVLKDVREILKEDGLLIISVHSRLAKGRWKIFWFLNNIVRKVQGKFGSLLEIGDKFAWEISGRITKGRIYLHIYTVEEALEDIREAGFRKISCKSDRELRNNVLLRDKSQDWIIYYWAEK